VCMQVVQVKDGERPDFAGQGCANRQKQGRIAADSSEHALF
jgi:hypothetical protein